MGATRLRVLVVDDNEEVGEHVRDALAAKGHAVRCVTDPTAALDEFRGGDYHVVVVDIKMPGLSGLDVIEQIRRQDNDVAVVVLTGHPSYETAAESIKYEVSAYIRKPLDTDDLIETVTRIMRRKGMLREREEELHVSIGRRIRELRQARSLTLKQMARRTSLSVSLLSQIERAESSASVASLYKVAAALDVPLSELFGGF